MICTTSLSDRLLLSCCRETSPQCDAVKHIPQVGAQVVASCCVLHHSTSDATLPGPGRSSAPGLASHGRDSLSGGHRAGAIRAVVTMLYRFPAILSIFPVLLLSKAGSQCAARGT